MGIEVEGGRMFWSAQAGAVGNVAILPSLQHLTLDVIAAAATSGIIICIGMAHIVHRRKNPVATIHGAFKLHPDHLYWGAAACNWGMLSAVSHAPAPAGLGSYVLLALTVCTMVIASLNGATNVTE